MYNENKISGSKGSEICRLLTAGSRTVVFEWNELTVLEFFGSFCFKTKTNITHYSNRNVTDFSIKLYFSEYTQH